MQFRIARNAKRRAQGRTPAFVAPMALAAVQRIDASFEIEQGINGRPPTERLTVRQQLSAPLITELDANSLTWGHFGQTIFSGHQFLLSTFRYPRSEPVV